MANWYYDPLDGDNASSGDSWSVEASGTDGVTNGTTTFTSVSGGFTGKAGRYIRILTSLYRIESVVSDTECVLDRTITSGSNRTWAIGGAVQSNTYLPYTTFMAAGDVVKYPKTGGWSSAGTLTYASQSDQVTMGAGRIAVVDDCESAWTGVTDVTVTLETNAAYRKFGSGSLKMVVGSAFATGKMAYFDFGAGNEKDLSSFQGISLILRPSGQIYAGALQVCLCSDESGEVVVDTIDLMPGATNLYTANWISLQAMRTGGGNLGSSIRSIAIYAAADPGTPTMYVDNIVAIKDFADANHICHNCLIGQGNTIDDLLWAVLGFTGATTIKLVGEWYGGSAGAQSSYKVEPGQLWGTPFPLSAVSSGMKYAQEIVNSGGWNKSTDIKDGVTCWRILPSSSSYYYAVTAPSYPYWAVENFIFPQALNINKYTNGVRIEDCGFAGTMDQTSCGLGLGGSNQADAWIGFLKLKNVWASAMNSYGIQLLNSGIVDTYSDQLIDWEWEGVTVYSTQGIQMGDVHRFRGKNIKFSNNNAGGYSCWYVYQRALGEWDIVNLELKEQEHATYAALHFNCCTGRVRIWNLVAGGNEAATFNVSNVEILCYNPDIDDATIYKTDDFLERGKVVLLKKDGDAEDHEIYTPRGTIFSETSVRHTAENIAWKLSPTNTDEAPISHRLAEIALEAGVEATVGLYMRRDNAGINGRIRIPGGWLAGMTEADYVSNITAGANIWELVTIVLTPTEDGVVELWVEVWGGTTYSVYADDLSVTV